jgi:hypothetical protein
MGHPFANMAPDEWPEGLTTEEQEQVFEAVQDVQYMKDHENDGPLPGASS